MAHFSCSIYYELTQMSLVGKVLLGTAGKIDTLTSQMLERGGRTVALDMLVW